MAKVMLLFIVCIILIAVFSIMTIRVVMKNNFTEVISFFRRYLLFVFIILLLIYSATIVSTSMQIHSSDLFFIHFIKYCIHLLFFVKIFLDSKALLNNLMNEKIFVQSNSRLTRQIGVNFTYLAITEIISGLVFAIGRFSLSLYFKEFRIQTNTTVVLFLVIGLILLIVSSILQKAIEIYEEHTLTI
jgi:Protein of unknown function (DUF2975)